LRRHEGRWQPPADGRPSFDRFLRNEGLQNRAYPSARGIAIAALSNRPRAIEDANHDVGGGSDSFLSDDELQLANALWPKARQQPLFW
jgi:hypothetical protein